MDTTLMNNIKLSILILTVPNRIGTTFLSLITELNRQIGERTDIEILALYDNKKRTVGQKRGELNSIAQGNFSCHIDDDDRISPEYISSIMNCIEANPNADCIVFDCETTVNGGDRHFSKYSKDFEYSRSGDQWRGKPAHTMVWRSTIAKKHLYANKNCGEDSDWVKRAYLDIVNEVRIDKVLYFYDYNLTTSETRGQ